MIVALADPLLGKAPPIAGTGPMVLFIDNGWTAAANWDARQAVIADVLRTATQQGRAVAIVPTADVPDVSLLDAGKAARIAQALDAGALAARPQRARRRRSRKRNSRAGRRSSGSATASRTARRAPPPTRWLRQARCKIYADGVGKGPLALLPPASDPRGFNVDGHARQRATASATAKSPHSAP